MVPMVMASGAMAQVAQPGHEAGSRVRAMLVGIERYEEQLAFPRCRAQRATQRTWLDGSAFRLAGDRSPSCS